MPRLLIVASNRWGYLWQRHQSLAVAAAADGWEVDYLQPRPRNLGQIASYPMRMIRKTRVEQEHPATYDGVSVIGRRGWTGSTGPYDMAIVYLPDLLTEWLLRRVVRGPIVYDAVLDWATVPKAWFPPVGWRSSERRIARMPRATVSTDAPGMAALLATRGMTAAVVPPAADDAFLAAAHPAWEDRSRHALYFGAVRAEVDVTVFERLVAAGVPVDVVGVIDDDAVRERLLAAGVSIEPPIGVEAIAARAARHRVILLPYRGARGATLAPAKLFNAVASGAWVLASGIDTAVAAAPGLVSLDEGEDPAEAVVRLAERAPASPQSLPTWASRWTQLRQVAGLPGKVLS
ncbi:hypothetical protein [Amnibacterium kyonggiense]|uniref:Glycosyltransferase involved in cell wall biosynthesis n=1 Tax=Amnibacterium kyonggiense TaxID=595671 RepID=A0A4R7FIP8_9MICO|nr:hypothetical protein [Amnibacterium kyonggiense]TDS74888.1 hypothetical protein CLV52_3410 [Amnibacterium kyonggiense]